MSTSLAAGGRRLMVDLIRYTHQSSRPLLVYSRDVESHAVLRDKLLSILWKRNHPLAQTVTKHVIHDSLKGPLRSPEAEGMTRNSYRPAAVRKAVSCWSFGTMRIWWNPCSAPCR